MNYSGINVKRYVGDLYATIYETLMRESET